MESRQKLFVDTKATCFLCMKDTDADETDDEIDCKPRSLRNLFRYLQIDTRKTFNNVVPLADKELEVMVVVCASCYEVLIQFDMLYQQLQLICLNLNASVNTFHKLMTDVEMDATQIIASNNSCQPNITGEIKLLRKQLSQKCSERVKSSLPQLKLERLSQQVVNRLKSGATAEQQSSHHNSEDSSNGSENDDSFSFEEDQMEVESPSDEDLKMEESESETQNPPKKSKKGNLRNKRKWKCKLCGKELNRLSLLKNHMRSHTFKEKPLPCPHCPKQFRSEKGLQQHTLNKRLCYL